MVRMLVTRPEPDGAETARRLDALGIAAHGCPLLEFETLDTGLPDATGFGAIALTSANALRALEARGALSAYRALRVFAVGERTAEEARRQGFGRVESAGGSFVELVELLAAARLERPIFYPTARDQAHDLPKALAPAGAMVIAAEVYAMNAIPALPRATREALAAGELDAALFYSRRTAATFVHLCQGVMDGAARARLGVLCLAESVAEPLIEAHFVRVGLADYPSEDAMMGLALSFARDQNAS